MQGTTKIMNSSFSTKNILKIFSDFLSQLVASPPVISVIPDLSENLLSFKSGCKDMEYFYKNKLYLLFLKLFFLPPFFSPPDHDGKMTVYNIRYRIFTSLLVSPSVSASHENYPFPVFHAQASRTVCMLQIHP